MSLSVGLIANDPEVAELGFYGARGKRMLDFTASLAGLAVLALPMAAIAMMVLFLDGRPILFRQQRVGRGGRLFFIFKFRTMKNAAGPLSPISIAGDSRVTSLGRWLRRFKLDELPQLWNVLIGDMSLVGPRPDVPGYLDRVSGEACALLTLRPGVTGPATLLFRREEEILACVGDHVRFNDEVVFPEKVRLNLEYLKRRSLLADLAYVLATVVPALSRALGVDRWLGLDYDAFVVRMSQAARPYSAV